MVDTLYGQRSNIVLYLHAMVMLYHSQLCKKRFFDHSVVNTYFIMTRTNLLMQLKVKVAKTTKSSRVLSVCLLCASLFKLGCKRKCWFVMNWFFCFFFFFSSNKFLLVLHRMSGALLGEISNRAVILIDRKIIDI